MLVKCVFASNPSLIVVERIYRVLAERKCCFLIKNELGIDQWFKKSWFEVVKDGSII
jgi:hypothetical protein